MKVLSIKEPYATLIRDGEKLIETRSWKTNYRGTLYIHASGKTIPKEYKEDKVLMLITGNRRLHFGEIIAKCELVDCFEMTDEFVEMIELLDPQEYSVGFYRPGRYAWVLKNVEKIAPVKARGMLGIWNYNA